MAVQPRRYSLFEPHRHGRAHLRVGKPSVISYDIQSIPETILYPIGSRFAVGSKNHCLMVNAGIDSVYILITRPRPFSGT